MNFFASFVSGFVAITLANYAMPRKTRWTQYVVMGLAIAGTRFIIQRLTGF